MTWAKVDGGKHPAWTTRTGATKAPRAVDELVDLSDGAVMRFWGPAGLVVTARKMNARRWTLFSGGTSVESLANMPAIEMVRRDA